MPDRLEIVVNQGPKDVIEVSRYQAVPGGAGSPVSPSGVIYWGAKSSSPLPTGNYGPKPISRRVTIKKWELLSDGAGTLNIDVVYNPSVTYGPMASGAVSPPGLGPSLNNQTLATGPVSNWPVRVLPTGSYVDIKVAGNPSVTGFVFTLYVE
jgi:hypothetical protein